MQQYKSREELVNEIHDTANAYIAEFENISDVDRDRVLGDDIKTPYQSLAYQLGWMELIQKWDRDEKKGREVIMPAPGIKWNQLGPLHERFYAMYRGRPLAALIKDFKLYVRDICVWVLSFSEKELFQPGGRRWASSTSSNWPVAKWIHINTVAPFKSFKTGIRKWKKLANT